MSRFALMSQTLRADECLAFIGGNQDSWTLITADRRWVASAGLPATTRVVLVESTLTGVRDRARAGLRRSILGWARSGSRLGAAVEQTVRRAKRAFTRSVTYEPFDSDQSSSSNDRMEAHTGQLVDLLESAHSEDPIIELAVFDVFDLPAAFAFAVSHDVPVAIH